MAPKAKPEEWGKLVGIVAAGLVLVAIIEKWPASVEKKEIRDAQESDAITNKSVISARACVAAQKAVKSRLKSPSSAKFPSCVFGAHQYEIRASDSLDQISVTGHVDASNSFGAILRKDFVVFLSSQDGNSEELVATEIAISD